MKSASLNERSLYILNTLVARYIRDGVPVGSKTLAQDSVVSLSAASIRNVMSELEEAGYISSPHPSAGRVPTGPGYRLFVDSVVTASTGPSSGQSAELIEVVRSQLNTDLAPAKLAENASNLLSSLTHQAGLVLLPDTQSQSFRQVEFLPLSNQRVLAILVLGEQEVQNRIIHTDRDYSEAQLQQAAGFVNHHYAGKSVTAVRASLLLSMEEDRSTIDQMMQAAIGFASQALADVEGQGRDYILAGQANLLASDHENMDHLRELFEAFQQKKDILHLMERCAQGEGVQIFIGDESGYDVLDDFSLITAPYQQQGQSIGVLGVIGPTRMAYERVVPMVDITAKLLGAAIKS